MVTEVDESEGFDTVRFKTDKELLMISFNVRYEDGWMYFYQLDELDNDRLNFLIKNT